MLHDAPLPPHALPCDSTAPHSHPRPWEHPGPKPSQHNVRPALGEVSLAWLAPFLGVPLRLQFLQCAGVILLYNE